MRGKVLPYNEYHKIIDDILYKKCSSCGEWFPCTCDNFYKNKANKADGFCPECKECNKNRSMEWKRNHHERVKEVARIFSRLPKTRIYNRGVASKRLQNGKYHQWQQENAELVNEYNRNRVAKKAHEISKIQWLACKEYFGQECAYCGLKLEEHFVKRLDKIIHSDFHKDHADDNGPNDLSNCIPACKICNSEKHQYDLDEWYNDSNPKFTKERYSKIIKWLSEDYRDFIEENNKNG